MSCLGFVFASSDKFDSVSFSLFIYKVGLNKLQGYLTDCVANLIKQFVIMLLMSFALEVSSRTYNLSDITNQQHFG